MTLRLVPRLAVALVLLSGLFACGGPVDEEWAGEEKECKTGNATDTGTTKVVLFLEGPVTAMPKGWYGDEVGDETYGLTAIRDAMYVGPMLNFTTEYKVTIGSSTMVTTGTFKLTKTPTGFTGEVEYKHGSTTTTCTVELEGRR
jgi:hypothetical protein